MAVAAYNLKSSVLLQKSFYRNESPLKLYILVIKSLFFFKYHHTALLIKKGGGQIEATIPCILNVFHACFKKYYHLPYTTIYKGR